MAERAEVPVGVVERLRAVCLGLPEAYEEAAWAGTRWCVRKRNFAHVIRIEGGWPPVVSRVAGTEGPATVLTFRSSGPELDALTHAGPPFIRPRWAPNVVGMILDDDLGAVDWDEVTELVIESYCLLAPQKLAALVDRPSA